MDCSVCCGKLTYSTEVECMYCNYKACSKCIKIYLLETTLDPHCMSCRHGWSKEQQMILLSKKFIDNQLKKHRENVLFDREKALMPMTQVKAQSINKRKVLSAKISDLDKEARALSLKLNDIESKKRVMNLMLRESFTEIRIQKKVICICPNDNCRGFVNSSWKCGMCHSKVCKHCCEIYTNKHSHICDENSKKTMTLLLKDSKSCPTCGVIIHKIEGCDQMFCVECKTGFSWRTGNVEKGILHNPHYYEFLKQNPNGISRTFGDFECGGLPNVSSYDISKFSSVRREFIVALRRTIDLEQYHMPKYRVSPIVNNEKLRIKYLLNEISETDFKQTLQREEKKRDKNRQIYDVLQMVHSVNAEYLRQIFTKDIVIDDSNLDTIRQFLINIQDYANKALVKISTNFNNCVIPFIVIV